MQTDNPHVLKADMPEPSIEIPQGTMVTESIDEANLRSLRGYFNANDDTDTTKTLTKIYRLFEGGTMAEILTYLHQTEAKIGATPLGMSRLQHMYNYLRVANEIETLKQEKLRLEGV